MKTLHCIITAGLFVLLSNSGNATTTWTNLVAGGTQYWNVDANWNGTFPNGVGANAVVNGDFKTADVTLRLGQNIKVGSLTMGDTAADPTSGFSIEIPSYLGQTLTFESSVPGGLTYLKVPVDIVQDPTHNSDAYIRAPVFLGGTSSLVIEPVGQLTLEAVYLQGNTLTVTNSGAIQNLSLNNQLYGGGSCKLVGNAGIQINKNNSSYGGAVEANAGTMTIATGGFPAANSMTINSGGLVVVGSYSAADPNPGQRLPTNQVCLAGGQLNHLGQALKGAALNQTVGDVVNEIKIEKGQSRVELQAGPTTAGTYLRAKVLTRSPGTVLAVAATKLGTNLNTTDRGQQFQVEGSLATIGGGGAEGTTTMKVVPWVFCRNDYYGHAPDRIATLSANGLRGLFDSEMDTTLAGTTTRNVNVSTAALSADQTVNSLRCNFYNQSNLGAGRTLHVTSGAVLLLRNTTRLGEIASASAGILDFGTAEGCVYATSTSENSTTAIGAVISGTGGVTLAGSQLLRLTAANTYSGTTSIASGLVQVGDGTVNTATARLGDGDVWVSAPATLRIASNVANAIANDATVTLQKAGLKNGKMELQTGINETVRFLFLGDEPMTAGTYGGTGSVADNILPTYFSGTGVLTVSSNAAALGGTTLLVVK